MLHARIAAPGRGPHRRSSQRIHFYQQPVEATEMRIADCHHLIMPRNAEFLCRCSMLDQVLDPCNRLTNT